MSTLEALERDFMLDDQRINAILQDIAATELDGIMCFETIEMVFAHALQALDSKATWDKPAMQCVTCDTMSTDLQTMVFEDMATGEIYEERVCPECYDAMMQYRYEDIF